MEANNKWRHLFRDPEWAWCHALSKAMHDPEEKKVFWETVITKKQGSKLYSVFDDFPKDDASDKKSIAQRYCAMILPVLKAHGIEGMKEKPKEDTEFGKHLGSLIDDGFHLSEEERAKKGKSA